MHVPEPARELRPRSAPASTLRHVESSSGPAGRGVSQRQTSHRETGDSAPEEDTPSDGDPYDYSDPYGGMPPTEGSAWKRYMKSSGDPYEDDEEPLSALPRNGWRRYNLLADRGITLATALETIPQLLQTMRERFREYESREYPVSPYRAAIGPMDFAPGLLALRQLIAALEELYDCELILAYRFRSEEDGWSQLAGVMNEILRRTKLLGVQPVSRQGLRSHAARRLQQPERPDRLRVEEMLRGIGEIRVELRIIEEAAVWRAQSRPGVPKKHRKP